MKLLGIALYETLMISFSPNIRESTITIESLGLNCDRTKQNLDKS